jgi:KUP system potassium uptake protein
MPRSDGPLPATNGVWRRRAVALALLCLAVLWVAQSNDFGPSTMAALLPVLTTAAIYGVGGVGLNLQFGHGGLLNFGFVAFMAVGAYTTVMLVPHLQGAQSTRHDGTLPLLLAIVVFTVMTTWRRGREIVSANRRRQEGSLTEFVEEQHARGLPRVEGTAVFPHPGKDTTPLALRANVEHNKVLHRGVLIVSATSQTVPHVPPEERFSVDHLGQADDGIQHLAIRFGFSDAPDLPEALREACAQGVLEPEILDVPGASYFLSRGPIRRTSAPGMATWRKVLFLALARNAADPAAYFGLPPARTVTMGSPVDV